MIKQISYTIIFLIFTLILFEFSNLDQWLQGYFFDNQLQVWLVDKDNSLLVFIFYSGFKKGLIVFAILLLLALINSSKLKLVQPYKRDLFVVLLSLIIVPVTINALKANTNVACPKQLAVYGGNYPSISLFESYPPEFHQLKRAKCFPAGHASGAFALMSLFFLFKIKKHRRMAILLAIAMGWTTGGYKMLIGDHFLSHTLVTMQTAWLLILTIRSTVYLVINYRTKYIVASNKHSI